MSIILWIVWILAIVYTVAWIWALVDSAKEDKWLWFVLILLFNILWIPYALFGRD